MLNRETEREKSFNTKENFQAEVERNRKESTADQDYLDNFLINNLLLFIISSDHHSWKFLAVF